ncbi:hypothetical protein EYC80_001147 [Monilinia laxa]|uniref:Uncharacterized protein n=1 Tax=Monilinia laxa TaxID=61186 RepID=A0A5N6K8B9_MONLA|nr:hypothetical protein EYC80_001147 [Monilinia laxa]
MLYWRITNFGRLNVVLEGASLFRPTKAPDDPVAEYRPVKTDKLLYAGRSGHHYHYWTGSARQVRAAVIVDS